VIINDPMHFKKFMGALTTSKCFGDIIEFKIKYSFL
jgi:hypothetical protein